MSRFGYAQRLSLARMKYSPNNLFRPGGVNKGLFNRIKYRNVANRIGSWFKRRYKPTNAVKLNNARMKDEFSRYNFSARHKAAVRRHFSNYSKMGKTAPPSGVGLMYKKNGWMNRPSYIK